MGLFDKFKKKGDKPSVKDKKSPKKEEKSAKGAAPAGGQGSQPKAGGKKAAKGSIEQEEVKTEAVVTPDGQLVSAPKKETKKKARPKKEDTGEAYRVLIRPLISEKNSSLAIFNKYVFEVSPRTNKIEVRKAIKKVYGVDPIKVNIQNEMGREVRYGRTEGRTKKWKKAIITLPQGQKIDIQEGI